MSLLKKDIPNVPTLLKSTHRNFFSKIANKDYRVYVAEPMIHKPIKRKSPVIYLLDANSIFMMVTEMVRMLQLSGELPDLYIVGIGYQDELLTAISNRRVQEFTPTSNPNYKKLWENEPGFESDGGDAILFMRFLQEELKPFIESTYPVDPNDATLVGDSLGGLFALYTLLQKPKAFEKYVIGSPAIFWDRGVLWEYEKQYADQHRNLNAQVFMAVGGLEDSEPYHFPADTRESTKHIRLVDDMKRMATTLEGRDYPDLKLHSHVFEGETHMSVIAPCINRGLRVLFRPTS